jgi:ribosome recycling factor
MKAPWFTAEDFDMISELKSTAEKKMKKSVEALNNDLGKIRTGRAHTGLLDHIMVDYYGSMVPVNQVANVTLVDARTIGVQPWEKNMVGKVEKAIRDSDLGLNPASVGELIRVPMPMLTEERRRDLIKVVKQEGEAAKVAIRNLRRDANSSMKDALKDKLISEDEDRRGQDEIQKLTDKYIAEVDALLVQKEQDMMQV